MLTLPPDYTFFIQLGSFFVLLLILNRMLFEPFLAALDERTARGAGDVAAAAAARAEVQSMSARIDADLAKSRAQAMAEVDAVRKQTRDEASKLFDDAHQEAASRLSELRRQVASATEEARGSLATDAKAMAEAMVAAVIGTKGAVR